MQLAGDLSEVLFDVGTIDSNVLDLELEWNLLALD